MYEEPYQEIQKRNTLSYRGDGFTAALRRGAASAVYGGGGRDVFLPAESGGLRLRAGRSGARTQ